MHSPRFVRRLPLPLLALFLLAPNLTLAHENYVLTKAQIDRGMADSSINVFSTLQDPTNLRIAVLVGLGSGLVFLLYFLFQFSAWGRVFDRQVRKLEPGGHLILRLALAGSCLASAYTASYLGPEISIYSLPLGTVLTYLLFILGGFLLFGAYTELVGVLGLLILLLATAVYGGYMFTYFNYFGEFIALILFGSWFLSVDAWRKKPTVLSQKYRDYEAALIRITYGISILYPAITIKLLHPQVIIDIVNQYHLNQFHWLFPQDPLLISMGAGLAQVAMGTCIILGLATRLNALISFSLMTLSVLFFKEAVWPHYILLALTVYLMINNGGNWTLDNYLSRLVAKKFKK